jgi:hypothetical protein
VDPGVVSVCGMDSGANAFGVIWRFEDNRSAGVRGAFVEKAAKKGSVGYTGAVCEDIRLPCVLKYILLKNGAQKWVSDGM